MRWYPCEKRIELDVALKNCTSDTTYYAPMKAIVKCLWPSGAEVLNPDGETEGKPYWDYSDLLGDRQLEPGESSEPKTWHLSSPLWGMVILRVRIEAEVEPPGCSGEIAFVRATSLTNWDMWVMDAVDRDGDGNGDNLRRLTNGVHGTNPSWSPDGRLIAHNRGYGTMRVYVMDLFSSGPDGYPTAVQMSNGGYDPEPCWSPAGDRIAFCGRYDGVYSIFVMDAVDLDGNGVGDNLVKITGQNSADAHHPYWSPDGRRIAFVSYAGGGSEPAEIHVADLRDWRPGTGYPLTTRLTCDAADDAWPCWCWAPGVNKIVFGSKRDGNYEIYVMDAEDRDGDGNGDNLARMTNHSAHDRLPCWSPDGRSIAFDSERNGNTDVYVMDAVDRDGDGKGDNLQRLTIYAGEDYNTAWKPVP